MRRITAGVLDESVFTWLQRGHCRLPLLLLLLLLPQPEQPLQQQGQHLMTHRFQLTREISIVFTVAGNNVVFVVIITSEWSATANGQ